MADFSVRIPALARALAGARSVVRRADRGLFGLEVLNSTADHDRGPQHWERMRGDCRAAFVLSTGRTGTKTLAALFDQSPHIAPHHEPEPRLIALSYLAWTGVEDERFWREAVQVARDPLLFEALKSGKLYFEASNRMTFLAPALKAAYPRSRFLLVSRRAGGFIKSAMKRGYYQGHPWDHARPRPAQGWGDQTPEQKCAWLWAETHRFALDFAEAAGDRAMILHAEDLFAGDLGRVVDVFAFVGVDPPPTPRLQAVLDSPRNAQVGTFPWGQEARVDEALLAPLADLERRLGYGA